MTAPGQAPPPVGRGHLRAALGFLTPLGGGAAPPTPESMAWFPVVGAGLGAGLGAFWRLAARAWTPLPAAALVVAADVAMTGALHLDGLADSADGLLAHLPRQSRLAIMAEPQVGTFAAVALGTVLIARTAALSDLEPSPALLASAWCLSRSMMVLGTRVAGPYARAGGLATPFLPAEGRSGRTSVLASLAGIGASATLATISRGRVGLEATIAGALAGAGVLGLAKRRLGGFTGDVLGAAGVMSETVALVVAARR